MYKIEITETVTKVRTISDKTVGIEFNNEGYRNHPTKSELVPPYEEEYTQDVSVLIQELSTLDLNAVIIAINGLNK